MYTAIDDKYLDIKKDDYNKLCEYLKSYYKIDALENEERYKNFHTYCWMIMIWLKELKKTGIDDKFFNDIFMNMIATVHCLIHNDMKISNFLLRNSIENFLRFFKNYMKEINIEDSPDSIFTYIFSNLDNGSLSKEKFQILKSVYSECCLYVHSALLKDNNLCDCLVNYDGYFDAEEVERFNNNFKNTYLSINSILILYNKKIFDNMSYSNQLTLRHYSIKEDLKSVFDAWSK